MTDTMAPRKSLRYVHDETLFLEHQVTGVRWMARHGSLILADEMGLGKSLEALTAFALDVERDWAKRMLVVCPATLKGNWADEIIKFTKFQHAVLDGTPARRSEQLDAFRAWEDPKILVVNYEQVRPHLADLNGLGFDIIVYDEAHAIKNRDAARTKAAQALKADRHFLLTGSPMLNHVNELWSLLYRIAPGEFPNYWSFVHRYALFGGWQNKQIIGVKNERELSERLNDYMLRRLKKDVLDLPDKHHIQIDVDLHPHQRALYKTIWEEIKEELPVGMDPANVDNALTKYLRLKQVTGTTATVVPGTDDSFKLDRLVADAVELTSSDNPVVIFTQFREVLACILRRLKKEGVPAWSIHGDTPKMQRVPTINDWAGARQAGALVAMLQVGGTGLNMTASRHVLFADKLYVPKLNEQAEDRCHRIGSSATQPVQIRSYIARRTVEQRIERILRDKTRIFDTVIETTDLKRALVEALREDDDVA